MVPSELDAAISDLEHSLERLHALYNQYFLGIERMEPKVHRKNVDRKIHALRRTQMNTAQKFRLQTQIQKYNTHSNHWKRICRQIEEGTYVNNVNMAKRRQAQKAQQEEEARQRSEALASLGMDMDQGQQEPPPPVFEIDMDSFDLDDPFGDSSLPAEPAPVSKKAVSSEPVPQLPKPSVSPKAVAPARPESPTKKSSLPRPSSPAKQKPGLDKARAAKIYRTYLAALKRCKQPTTNVSLDKIERSLNKKAASGKGNVDFKVVIRGGKASIKAVKKD